MWAARVGQLLDQVGRADEALEAQQEAAAIYRELAEAMPDQYRPDLARSLTNLGNRLGALWRPDDALRITQEAVGIYRELAEAMPDQYRPSSPTG
jgi:tetratricopeptide (TPR) repeat protein